MIYEKTKAKNIIADKDKINEIVSDTISKMAAIVGATLGPGGRPVLIERDGMAPLVTKDGVTVAKSIGVDKAEANVIVEAAKEICINTAKDAGDGTTTAIVLAEAIAKAGQDFIAKNPKYNPQRVIRELLDLYKEVIVPYLEDIAIEADTKDKLTHVATISANGDKTIAGAVVEAVLAAGEDGTVLLEEAQGNQMRVETIDGYIVTSGLREIGRLGPLFINDNANQQCKMDMGYVFLYDGSITDLKPLGFVQEAIEGTELYGSPLIIMAHEFSDIVMDKIASNVKGGMTICPVKTPRSGMPNSRSMLLRDMAAYTGARVFDPGDIADITEEDFGTFESARSTMYETFILSDPDSDAVDSRIEELKGLAKTCHSDFDRMFVKAAIGKLTGGISTIWVGGASDLEVREKKGRVEDAVEAVRSAIAEGIVPGGCFVHRKLIDLISKHENKKQSWDIMAEALHAPYRLLLSNCGEDVEDIRKLLEDQDDKIFNADTHEIVDPYIAGIIEPAKVARVSIANALSVAGLLTTLGGIVVVPRDSGLENQLALSKQAFKDMMGDSGLGQ